MVDALWKSQETRCLAKIGGVPQKSHVSQVLWSWWFFDVWQKPTVAGWKMVLMFLFDLEKGCMYFVCLRKFTYRYIFLTLHIYIYIFFSSSSSTAQGGGSFCLNRKPKGEVDCCEWRMATVTRPSWWLNVQGMTLLDAKWWAVRGATGCVCLI